MLHGPHHHLVIGQGSLVYEPSCHVEHGIAPVRTATDRRGEVASIAGPTILVLCHQLSHSDIEEVLSAGIRTWYDGDIVLGRDLDVF